MENQLVKLVNLFHEYEQQHPGAGIEDFCRHHLAISQLEKETLGYDLSKEVIISIAVGRLARFADMYTKKALAALPIANTDEIVYLMILDETNTPRKSELIHSGLSEFSTGVEIIRRLQKANLVEEFPDAEDRRSKRIRLTDQGKKLLEEVYPKMEIVSKMVASTLTEEEKDLLIQILGRLERRHEQLYSIVKTKNLEETAEVLKLESE